MSAALIEQIKDDLGYLKLDRSAEVFATLAGAACRDDQSHLEFLAALVVGEEAAATRHPPAPAVGACASPTSPPGAVSRSSTSASSPPSTPR